MNTGLLAVEDDSRNYIFENYLNVFKNKDIPNKFDLRQYMDRTIKNQGGEAMCSAYVAVTIKEFQEYIDRHERFEFSPEYIDKCKKDQTVDGITALETLKILKKYGCVTIDAWNDQFNSLDELKKTGQKYTIKGYYKINSVKGIKLALLNFGPVFFSVPIFNTTKYMWRQRNNEPKLSQHAMTIVGYNDDNGYFIVRNSMGRNWGILGYTFFDYDEWGAHLEAWAVIDKLSQNNAKLPKWYLIMWWKITEFLKGIGI